MNLGYKTCNRTFRSKQDLGIFQIINLTHIINSTNKNATISNISSNSNSNLSISNWFNSIKLPNIYDSNNNSNNNSNKLHHHNTSNLLKAAKTNSSRR